MLFGVNIFLHKIIKNKYTVTFLDSTYYVSPFFSILFNGYYQNTRDSCNSKHLKVIHN